MVTAVAHCAPPANKLTPGEIMNCRSHLVDTLALRPFRAFLCLGSVAWVELHRVLQCMPSDHPLLTSPDTNAGRHRSSALSGEGLACGPSRTPKFGHGVMNELIDGRVVFASFHPSQQNTFTGKLTEEMLDSVVEAFAARL